MNRTLHVVLTLAMGIGGAAAAGADSKSSYDDLVANLKSPNAKTRQEAAAALGKSRRREAVAQIAPLVRWQSGSRFSVTTGVDNALSGLGGQRAVQVSDNVYGDRSVNNYLNLAAFTSPGAGTYSTLKPNAFVGPSRLQNDLGVSRNFKFGARAFQFRWEVFNVLNKANFNNPTAALNSSNFGRILTAGDPRIMQFAFKYDF